MASETGLRVLLAAMIPNSPHPPTSKFRPRGHLHLSNLKSTVFLMVLTQHSRFVESPYLFSSLTSSRKKNLASMWTTDFKSSQPSSSHLSQFHLIHFLSTHGHFPDETELKLNFKFRYFKSFPLPFSLLLQSQ